MIDQADAAVAAWLSSLDGIDVDIDPPPDDARSGRATSNVRVHLVLTGVAERDDHRASGRVDVRDDDGRVRERRRSDRFFELRYTLVPTGPATATHRALSRLLQALVEHDHVPVEYHTPDLVEIGHPIPVELVRSATTTHEAPALVVQVTVPVRPGAERSLGPPVTELELHMEPPPEPLDRRSGGVGEVDALLADRRWTTVRRREQIAPREGAG